MAGRRVRIVRVRVAAWATAAAALLALPSGLALVEEHEREPLSPVVVQEWVRSPAAQPSPDSAVDLSPPSVDGSESIAFLRATSDVPGLLALAQRARSEDGSATRRRAVLAIASLGLVPTEDAGDALRQLVEDATVPSLERTAALAALWERGAVEFVVEQGRDSDDPAIRCKARVLQDRRRRSK